jgi:hypothetical protein
MNPAETIPHAHPGTDTDLDLSACPVFHGGLEYGTGTDAGDADDFGDDPWEGIPAELVNGVRPYDGDTAGGCG